MIDKTNQSKMLVALILITSGMAMLIVPLLVPETSLDERVRFVISIAGLMDLIFGVGLLIAARMKKK